MTHFCLELGHTAASGSHESDLQGESIETWMVFGEVIGVHIEERLITEGIYDTANAQHVMRGGGPADYFSIGPEQLFRLYRPQ